ncbi:MAG: response regulator [Bdellovibrionaceae bacterium]|nr:response regulator [Pseudobdellovibrionaceae bacterium]
MNLVKKWILLVEDDKAFADLLMADLVKISDFKMIWAKTLPEGMTKLNNQKFSCILLDLQLEKHSGLKLIQQVRNPNATKQLNADTPIILMSGYLKGDVVVSVATLVQGIIAKPFKPTDVIQKIRDAIDGTDTPLETAAAAPAPTLNSAAGVTSETLSKFVHDLNNLLAIVDMSMDRLTKNLTEIKATRELENVAKIDGHVKRIINLVKDFREAKNKAS